MLTIKDKLLVIFNLLSKSSTERGVFKTYYLDGNYKLKEGFYLRSINLSYPISLTINFCFTSNKNENEVTYIINEGNVGKDEEFTQIIELLFERVERVNKILED